MTIEGAIVDLQNLIDNEGIPFWAKPSLQKIKETVEAERKEHLWIPVTVRLPEENGRYLVTRGLNACGSMWNRTYIANYSDLMGLKSERIWWQGNVGKSDFEQLKDVTAWMPLPKHYEGGQRMKKRIKAHIRKKCRKCGALLVNKPEYGAVCPKCGWCRGWYTDKEGADAPADAQN